MSAQPDSPRTGSPQAISSALQKVSGSIRRTPPPSSPTTGEASPAQRAANSIGTPRSEIAAANSQAVAVAAAAKAFDLQAAPARLQHLCAALLVWGETSRFSGDEFMGVEISGVAVKPDADMALVQEAADYLARMCAPADIKLVVRKLAELKAMTVSRARDEVDMELVGAAYGQRLAQYPADVVNAACDRWANREEFWPSWAELKGECDKLMRGRTRVRDALNAWRPA